MQLERKRLPVSGKMSRFMGLKDDMASRAEVGRFIVNYIKDNDLKDPNNGGVVHPDETLSDLLDYEEYKARVLRGEQTWNRRDNTTGEKIKVVETDPKLSYSVIQHLMSKHINVFNFDLDGAIYNRNIIE